MYRIFFYRDRKGKSALVDYLTELSAKHDKNSRVKFNKISDYIDALSKYGTRVGEPYVKHLEGEIWELRPLRDRILFVGWVDDSFVLLHQFIKKTQKTPTREIEKAKRELADLKERGVENEK